MKTGKRIGLLILAVALVAAIGVSVTAWLIGVAMTVFFTVVVNAIALRKVKHLKLTDVT